MNQVTPQPVVHNFISSTTLQVVDNLLTDDDGFNDDGYPLSERVIEDRDSERISFGMSNAKEVTKLNASLKLEIKPSLIHMDRRGLRPRESKVFLDLDAALEGGGEQRSPQELFRLFSLAIVGGNLPIIVHQLLPHTDPFSTSGGWGWWVGGLINCWFVGCACTYWVACAGGEATKNLLARRSICFRAGIVFTSVVTLFQSISYSLGIFPVPLFVVCGGVLGGGFLSVYLYFIIVKKRSDRKSLLWELIRGVAVLALAVVFVVYLVAARVIFINLDSDGQTYFCPLFFLGKVMMKQVGKIIVFRGTNPSFEPLVSFWMDLICAIFANLLFLDVIAPRTFVVMVGLDLTENIYHAWKGARLLRNAKSRQAVPTKVARAIRDKSERREVLGNILTPKRQAMNYILCLAFSEIAEVCASLISIPMIVALSRFGAIYDYNSLVGASASTCHSDISVPLTYSLVDCILELLLFAFICIFIRRTWNIQTLTLASVLVDHYSDYFFFACTIASVIVLLLYLTHGGVDPSFEFGWISDDNFQGIVDVCKNYTVDPTLE